MAQLTEVLQVKRALRAAGIPFRSVHHGSGTTRFWLYIKGVEHEQAKTAIRVAQAATGRRGLYDGKISA